MRESLDTRLTPYYLQLLNTLPTSANANSLIDYIITDSAVTEGTFVRFFKPSFKTDHLETLFCFQRGINGENVP